MSYTFAEIGLCSRGYAWSGETLSLLSGCVGTRAGHCKGRTDKYVVHLVTRTPCVRGVGHDKLNLTGISTGSFAPQSREQLLVCGMTTSKPLICAHFKWALFRIRIMCKPNILKRYLQHHAIAHPVMKRTYSPCVPSFRGRGMRSSPRLSPRLACVRRMPRHRSGSYWSPGGLGCPMATSVATMDICL